jgi:CheY-like chemotaxis protein
MEHKYCALIVDGNLEHRARLKLAMRATSFFPTVHVANSLQEAELRLSEEPIDIVFIAMREDGDVINSFIHRSKQEPAGRDAAYVLLLEGRRSSIEIARTLVDGADAILLEPYSVESLQTISQIAEKMKTERLRAHVQATLLLVRMQGALRLLVREIAAQLGQVARLEKSGASGSVSRGVLQEMCSVLGELDPETRSLYFEVLLEIFPELPATHNSVHVGTYQGVSHRVRRHSSVRAIETVKKALVA